MSVVYYMSKDSCYDLPEPPPKVYYAISSSTCVNGQPVGFEYGECTYPECNPDETPIPGSGGSSFAGNQAYHDAIASGEAVGNYSEYLTPTCNMNQDFLDATLQQVAGAPPCDQLDEDGDGVPDNMDECPGTPQGDQVDLQGCTIEDEDGDGVSDNDDNCPGTDEGVSVDKYGCPVDEDPEEDDTDTDEDGVPDSEDDCPGSAAGAVVDANGCPVEPDPNDPDPGADNADDTEELNALISWTKKVEENTRKTSSNTGAIKSDVDVIRDHTGTMAGNSNQIKNDVAKIENNVDSIEQDTDIIAGKVSDFLDMLKGGDSAVTAAEGLDKTADYETLKTELQKETTIDALPDSYREKTLMQTAFDAVIQNNPINDVVNGISLTASGDCSFQYDYKGRAVNFTVCQYASELDAFGRILLTISTLGGIVMIIRR